jgi:signal transduction histidine kinase/CheY-like chemotaxis protein
MSLSSISKSSKAVAAVVFPGLSGSDPLRAKFLEHWYADGLAQTSFAISLMGIGAVLMWLIYGITAFEGTGWFEANQLQRFFRIVAIGLFLGVLLGFWRFWETHWKYLAFVFIVATYSIGILLLKAKMEKTGLPMTSVGGWRSVVTQLMIIFCTYPFIRVPLWILIAVSGISSTALVYFAFYDTTQAMFAGVGLFIALVAGVAIWFNNYRRERNLFNIQERLQEALEESQVLHDRQLHMARAITHDIRQPMAALGLHVGHLRQQRRAAGVNDPHDELEPVANALEALRDQVNAIAAPILHDTGVPLNLTPVFANRLVVPTADLFRSAAQDQGIDLSVWVGDRAANTVVRTDETKVTTILQSLVSNAIKFSSSAHERSKVLIGLSCSGDSVSIRVFDNGIGIASDDLDRIFEEGFSTESSQTDSYGLGLYNVRRLVDALPDHTITVSSRLDRYTCMKLSLPLYDGPDLPPLDAPSELENEVGRRTDDLSQALILIVEDSALVAEGLVTLFSAHDAQPIVSANYDEAMQAVRSRKQPFDFLVCDYDLGEGNDGLVVIRDIRAHYNDQVPAVIVSGEAGVVPATVDVQVLAKPFDVNNLLAIALISMRRRTGS